MEQTWFSAKLRFAVVVETIGITRYMDSVFLFKSTDFEPAFQKALEIGHQREQCYLNPDQQRVEWRLVEVVSLDMLEAEISDGREVYSEPVNPRETKIPTTEQFHPEASRPTQTGV